MRSLWPNSFSRFFVKDLCSKIISELAKGKGLRHKYKPPKNIPVFLVSLGPNSGFDTKKNLFYSFFFNLNWKKKYLFSQEFYWPMEVYFWQERQLDLSNLLYFILRFRNCKDLPVLPNLSRSKKKFADLQILFLIWYFFFRQVHVARCPHLTKIYLSREPRWQFLVLWQHQVWNVCGEFLLTYLTSRFYNAFCLLQDKNWSKIFAKVIPR